MRKFVLSIIVLILSIGLFSMDAAAKRFGGGKSFGQSRSFSNGGASSHTAQNASVAKPASTASRWLGPLAGLAMGGLLASLFMGHGLGTGILSWLMIAGVIFILWRIVSHLRASKQSHHNSTFQTEPGRVIHAPFTSTMNETSAVNHNQQSVHFDEETFLRQAKTVFIRLQAAYDNKNLADIREFTTPSVFAEVQMQLQERGEQPNHTEVLNINAELVDLDTASHDITASVRFSGLIREQHDLDPENIQEIWHFTKDTFSQNWFVAGIQQIN